jgi:hypothetical protein
MKLELYRKFLGKDYTIGKLYINGDYFCDVLEDTVRPEGVKLYGKTAIPYGTYDIILTYSPRFKQKLPLLLNVPNFEGIRIHSGNIHEHTEGCLLVGYNKKKGMVLDSKKTLSNLMYKLNIANDIKEKVYIEIK